MGPRSGERGNTDTGAMMVDVRRLQWGRVLVNAETPALATWLWITI